MLVIPLVLTAPELESDPLVEPLPPSAPVAPPPALPLDPPAVEPLNAEASLTADPLAARPPSSVTSENCT